MKDLGLGILIGVMVSAALFASFITIVERDGGFYTPHGTFVFIRGN